MRDGELESERPLESRYANLFQVGYNGFEFLLEFGQCHENEKVLWHSRIVCGPPSAKEFLLVLTRTIAEYEARHGGIETPNSPDQ